MRLLKVTTGPAAGQLVEVEHEIVIGREGADLTIDDPEMSRRHTAVRPAGDGVEIEDLGSTNGTFVDDRRIDEIVTLHVSGTLRVGLTSLDVEISADRTVLRAAPARGLPEVEEPPDPVVPDLDVTAARDRPVVP
ncbi:MAG: FHA domain-containing protein, partial [Solirubrobacteraceae bacterium]